MKNFRIFYPALSGHDLLQGVVGEIYKLTSYYLLCFMGLISISNSAQSAANCLADVAGHVNCTSNDVDINNFVLISGPPSCVNGTTIFVQLQAQTASTAKDRYDIGYWVAQDGGDALTGMCYNDYLPPPLNTTSTPSGTRTSPYFDAEFTEDPGDTCGDLEKGILNERNLGGTTVSSGPQGPPAFLSVICEDSNSDGVADVSACTSWTNDKSAGTVNKPSCISAAGTIPKDPAKCGCQAVNLGIAVMIGCGSDTDCNDNNSCTTDTCTGGICSNTPVDAGTSCDDGNPCTTGDVCDGNITCAGTPITCTALDQCHVAGTCDSSTGLCTNPDAPDGTTCDDMMGCTSPDTCTGGVCSGIGLCPVGQICLGNNCQHTSSCSVDSNCNDNNPCTTNTCDTATGHCVFTAIQCQAQDQCHNAGTCSATSTTTFTCSNPVKSDGSSCNDDMACTSNDVCTGGTCGGTPVVCTPPDTCSTSSCDTITGQCDVMGCLAPEFCDNQGPPGACIQCDGTHPCPGGTCTNGTCVGCASAADCPGGNLCNIASCNTDHVCVYTPATCNDTIACTVDSCDPNHGGCIFTPVDDLCDNGDQCNSPECDSNAGCTTLPLTGNPCNDLNACTTNDTCNVGTCIGTPVGCAPPDSCSTAFCNGANGQCVVIEKCNLPLFCDNDEPVGDCVQCDNTHPCPGLLSCQAGVCIGCSSSADCPSGVGCIVGSCINSQCHFQASNDPDCLDDGDEPSDGSDDDHSNGSGRSDTVVNVAVPALPVPVPVPVPVPEPVPQPVSVAPMVGDGLIGNRPGSFDPLQGQGIADAEGIPSMENGAAIPEPPKKRSTKKSWFGCAAVNADGKDLWMFALTLILLWALGRRISRHSIRFDQH